MAIKTIFVNAIPIGKSTPHAMFERFEVKELAELCDPTGLVDAALFKIFLQGGDISGYTPTHQAAVQDAMRTLCRACHDADSLVESYLYSAQSGYELITDLPIAIVNAACDIARFNLYDTQFTEVVLYRYEHALKFLQSLVEGILKIPTSEAPPSTMGVFITSNKQFFNENVW